MRRESLDRINGICRIDRIDEIARLTGLVRLRRNQ